MNTWTEDTLTPAARAIVRTASTLFYEHGIAAIGVDRIAEESGVTKRTLYNRFGSKDELVRIYLLRRHALWWQAWQEKLAQTKESRVLSIFDSYLTAAENHHRGCAFLNAATELPDNHPALAVIAEHKRLIREQIAQLLKEEHQTLQTEAERDAIAEHIFLILEGAVAHLRLPDGYQRFKRARNFAAALLATA